MLYVAVKDDDGKTLNVKSKEIELQTGETYDAEFEFAVNLDTVEIFFWEKDKMRPFAIRLRYNLVILILGEDYERYNI